MPLGDLWPHWRAAWILHEDADLIVVDKPAGVSTHAPEPGRSDDAHSRVTAWLEARDAREDPSVAHDRVYLGIHQRLDRDTSGVLLFTRRKEANRAIAEQFEGRRVKKTYVACVTGLPRGAGQRQSGVLEHRIAPAQDEKGGRGPARSRTSLGTMRALPRGARGGQEAVTRWRLIERVGDRALLELSPLTGRTHQIRVQLAAEGAPIAGDVAYGGPPAPRLLLHATSLSLQHGGREQTFHSPVPPAFEGWVRGAAKGPLALGGEAGVDAIEAALRDSAARRYGVAHSPGTDAFRILHDAGDGLPGVTVDVYGDHLVVALLGDEATSAREAVLDAAARLGAAGVYVKVRPKHASRIVDSRRDELAPREAVRGASAPESFTIHELGLPFEVRLGDGLSTGIFLDQRENRRRVRELARGARVCNLFAYTGAFTVAAAAGGAIETVTVDVSRGALQWARRNLDAIGADPAVHELVEADALVWLERLIAQGGSGGRTAPQSGKGGQAARARRFDLIVLDPPSFATTKQTRFSAESDYRGLAALALGALAPGGRLLACTNHRGIVRAKLRRYLHEAARAAGREVTQMKDLPDPVDFPPEPGSEPHLKSLLVTVS